MKTAIDTSLSREQLLAENTLLKQELAQLKRLIFGQKRERFIANQQPEQIGLDLGLAADGPAAAPASETITYQRHKPEPASSQHPNRQLLPAHLPRIDITIEPKEDTSGMKKIGEEITEELEYKPGTLFVNRFIRPKYAKAEGSGVLIALLPSRPIEKGIPGPGLLAHLAIAKFVDHLPLYRQGQMLKRQGVEIPGSTLGDWIGATCTTLQPLWELHRERVLQADYLQVDETTIRVLDYHKKGKTHLGYHWVYHDPVAKQVLFDYRPGRGREGPVACLEKFRGYLQTDGYSVYDAFIKRKDIVLFACMAHARRKFSEALSNDRGRAEHALSEIAKLYAIERRAREGGLSPEQRQQLRQQEAAPIVADLKIWLMQNRPQVLPQSAIGKAIDYALARWSKLERYIKYGQVEIDNNLVENAIRPVALGRKNYLFAGSHDGARRAAMLYALLSTAKLHGVEPFVWLSDVLRRIADHPHKQLEQLLPANWTQATPA